MIRLHSIHWKGDLCLPIRAQALDMINRNGGRVRPWQIGADRWDVVWNQ